MEGREGDGCVSFWCGDVWCRCVWCRVCGMGELGLCRRVCGCSQGLHHQVSLMCPILSQTHTPTGMPNSGPGPGPAYLLAFQYS